MEYGCKDGMPWVTNAKVTYSNVIGEFDSAGLAMGIGMWKSEYAAADTKIVIVKCPEGKKGNIAKVTVTVKWVVDLSWQVGLGFGPFGFGANFGTETNVIGSDKRMFDVKCCCDK
jgi:hypothetical protein